MEMLKTLKDKVMGTDEQNKAASERMRKMDEKNPDTTQAKVNRMVNKKPSNEELLAPMQAAFDKYEKKKAEAKTKAKEEKDTSRSESMTMDEMKMRAGGKVSSASKRADGCAIRGKTRA
jgi:hypothetical protein